MFDTPAVYLITKGEATADNFAEKRQEILDVVRMAVDGGVSVVQLREKQLPSRLVYELAVDAAALTRGTETGLLINDRFDIALAAGADGAHLTSTSIPADVVRRTVGDTLIVGVSTHSIDEVQNAATDGADFAVFGPVFDTPGKGAGQGIDELRRVCDAVAPFPVIAIGGIDAVNCRTVISAGASGVAGIRAFGEPEQLAAMLRRRFGIVRSEK